MNWNLVGILQQQINFARKLNACCCKRPQQHQITRRYAEHGLQDDSDPPNFTNWCTTPRSTPQNSILQPRQFVTCSNMVVRVTACMHWYSWKKIQLQVISNAY